MNALVICVTNLRGELLDYIENHMMKRLAIIIPAYKATFLYATLDSIAAQTCKDFTLYVGDDCSPEPIGNIVEKYRDKINLFYQRFDTNLGSKDLVAQWERCIAMSHDEPYIWLFSDDDVMEPNCVEQLLKTIDEIGGIYDLYHFDVEEINEEGNVTKALPEYPSVLSAYEFYKGKTTGRYRSYVVENVFSRRVYQQAGGFKNFDLAWGSDVATWCIFSGSKGMCKIPDAHVCWRRSSQNITPDTTRDVAERKVMAEVAFLEWSFEYFKKEKDILQTNTHWFKCVVSRYQSLISYKCMENASQMFHTSHGCSRKSAKINVGYIISLLVNWPLYITLMLKTRIMKEQYAQMWYEDAANFPNLNFFQLLNIHPYYRQVLLHRLKSVGRFLRCFYPNYKNFSLLPYSVVPINGGIYLDHPYCTVLAAASIGRRFKTKHLVTIGNNRNGLPTIGDNVFVGAGAVVCGPITIGDNAQIGANAVVMKDVPSNCTVIGNPAIIVRKDGKKVNIPL